MRLFLIALIALGLAAGVAVAIQYDSGYVLVAYGRTTVEMTVWVAAALLLVVLFVLWLLLSLLSRSVRLSDRLGVMRNQRRIERERQRSHRGVLAYAEGNWLQAKRLLLSSASSDKPLINYLLAARASQRLGDERGVAQALSQAENSGPHADIAVTLTQAELQMERGQLEEALANLMRLRKHAERYPAVLMLLARVYRGLGDWEGLRKLVPELRKRKLLADAALQELEREALRGELLRLRQVGEAEPLLQWWRQLGRSSELRGELLEDMVPALLAVGRGSEASKLLRAAIKQQWRDELVLLYASISDDDPARQLSVAESWLKEYSDRPGLLLALGRICLRNELWGKAREYLERAHRLATTAPVCFELARLLEHLGEAEESARYLREGLMLQGQQLPDLPMPQQHTL